MSELINPIIKDIGMGRCPYCSNKLCITTEYTPDYTRDVNDDGTADLLPDELVIIDEKAYCEKCDKEWLSSSESDNWWLGWLVDSLEPVPYLWKDELERYTIVLDPKIRFNKEIQEVINNVKKPD